MTPDELRQLADRLEAAEAERAAVLMALRVLVFATMGLEEPAAGEVLPPDPTAIA